MTLLKFPLVAAVTSVIALGACTDPNGSILAQDGDANKNLKNGALIGAGAGAVIGALSRGDGNRDQGAIKGALIGAALGAGGGALLDKQESDLRASLGNDNVTITNTGDRLIVTLPQDILFATGSSAVRPDLQRDLGAVSSNLQAYPDSTIQIIGHTDSDGDASYNQQLSESRANAVANVLINNGTATSRIRVDGRGESQPVSSNLTPEGKAQNRRVEIIILPNAA
ncbi:OmpA family protein [Sulfitobacter donghicola]|uniref:Membrane protein n=1 Tax=Sulfitobacter donghicola DSW-25 = KCTC 12864 = JCM 14565 TaxID=1300350 RepID=A0A073IKK7_9RHOB|nr:OmpA family protein [Sulfitobacter donghicola]KEJ90873.1 membrane protein [Sulfitobacter donghicola DSW-25 = KCTC 12864 = JCM 14565]KIN68152.1 putative inner membrane lipoprotein [Sulfitobacter donghicola DSW-25 = KCTC 12864 = JCM 14565]